MKKIKEQPLRIGEIGFTDDGVKVRCLKSVNPVKDCENCYFHKDESCNKKGSKFVCSSLKRSDMQDVYFKKIDK